ncbi:hypothetical protein B0H13DRAFT_2366313 [Mycena leptocephala]|nr:hypothetical protein B0H13DRAFT_2366313 [Mycena leptocephala]
MDDNVYFTDYIGNPIKSTWTARGEDLLCSVYASPESVPLPIMSFREPAPYLLQPSVPKPLLKELDPAKYAVWYNPHEHWTGWIPCELPDDAMETEEATDPVGFCFSAGEVETVADGMDDRARMEHHSEALDAADEAKRTVLSLLGFIAWFLSIVEISSTALSPEDQKFVASLRLGDRNKAGVIYDLTRDLNEINFAHLLNNKVGFHYVWSKAERNEQRLIRFSPEYYNELSVLRDRRDIEEIRMEDLASFDNWKEALLGTDWNGQNLRAGKRGDIIRKFQPDWEYYIVDFHLWGARPVVHRNAIRAYSERFKAALGDNHHGTFCTFFRQNPLHVDEPLFLRPEPVHLHELTDFATKTVGEGPSEEDIYYESSSVVREQRKIFYAPRLGRNFNSFNGRLTDEVATRVSGPSSARRGRGNRAKRMTDRKRLTESSSGSYGEPLESSPLKDCLGPFTADSFDPKLSPSRAHEREDEANLESRWARSMAAGPVRRHSSRSMSPRNSRGKGVSRRSRSLSSERTIDSGSRVGSFEEEFQGAAKEREVTVAEGETTHEERPEVSTATNREDRELPFESAPTPLRTWSPGFQTREEALGAIGDWVYTVMDFEPCGIDYEDLQWNQAWLKRAFLVFEDPRTLLRLKAIAACLSLERMEDVLKLAMRFGMKFEIYIKMRDVEFFRDASLTTLARSTLGALFTPGYVDTPMKLSANGPEAQYVLYEAGLYHLLDRPEATAFLYAGGVLKFVAEVYDRNLAHRLVKGPSVQVTEFQKGKTLRVTKAGESVFYTTDDKPENGTLVK